MDGPTVGRTDGLTLSQTYENAFNKAGCTAQDAPCTRLKITGDGLTDGPTDLRTDGRTRPHIEMRERI